MAKELGTLLVRQNTAYLFVILTLEKQPWITANGDILVTS